MLETQRIALIKRVRDTLSAGQTIAIVGWRNNHHTDFTRSLPPKKVRFYEKDKPPKTVGDTIGLIILTKYVGHKHTVRICGETLHNVPIPYRTIIEILGLCAGLISTETPNPDTSKKLDISLLSSPAEPGEELLEFITRPRERKTMSKMEKFAREFTLEAEGNRAKPGYVGSRSLSTLRAKCEVEETSAQLVHMGWVIGEASNGSSKIGWYKAGEKLIAAYASSKLSSEPEDPYAWAQWKASQRNTVLEKIAVLESDIERLKQELADIEKAERALQQLKELCPQKK